MLLFDVHTPSHSKVEAVYRAVYIIHGTDDIDILWNIKLLIWVRMQIRILRGDFSGFASVSRIYREEQFTEYFRNFSTVNFIDNEYVLFQFFLLSICL